ncbi:hypothetical protein JYU34_006747, partial [Plutella xylostella]
AVGRCHLSFSSIRRSLRYAAAAAYVRSHNRVEDYNYDEAVDGVSAKRAFEDETVMDEDGECVNAVGVYDRADEREHNLWGL